MTLTKSLFFLALWCAVRGNGNVPSIPRDVRLTKLNEYPTIVQVTWQPPEHPNGEIYSYMVRYGVPGQSDTTIQRMVPGNMHRLTTDVLERGSTYEFLIVAGNEAGYGEERILTLTTPDGLPSAPRDINLFLVEEEPPVARVTWDPPQHTYGGDIQHYRLRKTILWSDHTEEFMLAGDTHDFTTGYLEQGVTYEFGVAARNDLGYGEENVMTIRTPDGIPGGAPMNITAADRGDTDVHLQWDPPAPHYQHGEIVMYELLYSHPHGISQAQVVNTTDNHLLIEGLEPNTEYLFQIRAYTSKGGGPWGPRLPVRTLPPTPHTPTCVASTRLSPTVARVTWCENTLQDITSYRVYYNVHAVLDMDEWHSLDTTGQSAVAYIRDLEPGVQYAVRVRANSHDLVWSDFSDIAITATNPVPPERCYFEAENYALYDRKDEVIEGTQSLAECERYCDDSSVTCASVDYVVAGSRTGTCYLSSNSHVTDPDNYRQRLGSMYASVIPCPERCYVEEENFVMYGTKDYIIEGIDSLAECEKRCDAVASMTPLVCRSVDYISTGKWAGVCSLSNKSHVTHPEMYFPNEGSAYAYTVPCPAPSAPRNLSLSVLLQDPPIVQLMWELPEQTYGEVKGFRLIYGIQGGMSTIVRELPGDSLNCIAGFLEEGATYEFRVSANNGAGYGDEVVGIIRTPDMYPHGPPQNLIATSQVLPVLKLQWQPPMQPVSESDTTILYEISYRNVADDDISGVHAVNTTANHLLIENLNVNSEYIFQIRAYTKRGVGLWSSPLHFRTSEDVTDADTDETGCPDIDPPPDAWVLRVGNTVMIQCNITKETWYLICQHDQWTGDMADCSSGGDDVGVAHNSDVNDAGDDATEGDDVNDIPTPDSASAGLHSAKDIFDWFLGAI